MKRLSATAFLIFAVGYGGPACAADATGESVEWLVVSRPHIAIEEVTATVPVKKPGTDIVELTIQTRLKEVLKGQPPQQASFIRRWQAEKPGEGGAVRPDNGTEYLLFFNDQGNVTNAINLKFPPLILGVGVDPSDVAVATDFTILKSKAAIIDTVHHRLAQLSQNAGAHAAESPKRVGIGMDKPAWNIFYDGGACDLLVPNDTQDTNSRQETPVMRTAKFSGPAATEDCSIFPKPIFELKSTMAGEPHTLSVDCSSHSSDPEEPRRLTLTFLIEDVAREANYDFPWGNELDLTPSRQGFIAQDEKACSDITHMLEFRAGGKIVSLADPTAFAESGPSLMASWTAACVPKDAGYNVVFKLNVKLAPKAGAPAPSP